MIDGIKGQFVRRRQHEEKVAYRKEACKKRGAERDAAYDWPSSSEEEDSDCE